LAQGLFRKIVRSGFSSKRGDTRNEASDKWYDQTFARGVRGELVSPLAPVHGVRSIDPRLARIYA